MIKGARDALIGKKRLNFRGKQGRFLRNIIVDRLDPKPVSDKKQRLLHSIKERERKFTSQQSKTIGAAQFVEIRDYLSVRANVGSHSRLSHKLRELFVIINFAVAHDKNCLASVVNRLRLRPLEK